MERRKRRRAVELVKDLLILLLALSAVYLTLRTQMYANLSGGKAGGWLSGVLDLLDRGTGTLGPTGTGDPSQPVEVRPMRLAVNIQGVGRYGVQYNQAEADQRFNEVFSLLGEALGSAKEPRRVTEQQWRAALGNPEGDSPRYSGLYFDFQGKVPIQALYAWLESGGSNSALADADVRRVLLAEEEGGAVVLYYSNERDGSYYACGTSETLAGHLQNAVSAYNANGATFAFEYGEGDYERLDPYVMVQSSPPSPEVYRAANPVAQMDEDRSVLLEALGFHPQSNASYHAGGRLVVKEGADSLTVEDSGLAVFHGGEAESPRYPVGTGEAAPTHTEMVEVTQRLAEGTVGAWCGAARLYLMGVEETGEGAWRVDYGYSLNGAAVQLGQEGYAARFIVRNGQVSDFYLSFRNYTATGEQTLLLPEVQAAAAMEALGAQGRELVLAYEDGGTAEIVTAGWIAV